MKIAVISHAQTMPTYQYRWRRLAQEHNVDVSLIVPKEWIQNWFGEEVIFKVEPEQSENFAIYPHATTSKRNWNRYLFLSLDASLRKIQPDVIFLVQEETLLIHHQVYWMRNRFSPHSKIIFFSMNARGVPMKHFAHQWMWKNICQQTDAVLAHYPGCLESLKSAKYPKPIFLQTQVGVNEHVFKKDNKLEKAKREELGWKDKFIIGYCGRLIKDKGLDVLVAAVQKLSFDWALLLVGNGAMRDEVQTQAERDGWSQRLHITGYLPQEQTPAYYNAMDLFVLGSRTTPHWIDTFPNVTVQAMACQVPVIATDSAAIPWQLGDAGVLIPEGDVEALRNQIIDLQKKSDQRNAIAQAGQERSLKNFCIGSLNKKFLDVVEQIVSGKIRYNQQEPSPESNEAY